MKHKKAVTSKVLSLIMALAMIVTLLPNNITLAEEQDYSQIYCNTDYIHVFPGENDISEFIDINTDMEEYTLFAFITIPYGDDDVHVLAGDDYISLKNVADNKYELNISNNTISDIYDGTAKDIDGNYVKCDGGFSILIYLYEGKIAEEDMFDSMTVDRFFIWTEVNEPEFRPYDFNYDRSMIIGEEIYYQATCGVFVRDTNFPEGIDEEATLTGFKTYEVLENGEVGEEINSKIVSCIYNSEQNEFCIKAKNPGQVYIEATYQVRELEYKTVPYLFSIGYTNPRVDFELDNNINIYNEGSSFNIDAVVRISRYMQEELEYPGSYDGDIEFEWSCDNNRINITPNGRSCSVSIPEKYFYEDEWDSGACVSCKAYEVNEDKTRGDILAENEYGFDIRREYEAYSIEIKDSAIEVNPSEIQSSYAIPFEIIKRSYNETDGENTEVLSADTVNTLISEGKMNIFSNVIEQHSGNRRENIIKETKIDSINNKAVFVLVFNDEFVENGFSTCDLPIFIRYCLRFEGYEMDIRNDYSEASFTICQGHVWKFISGSCTEDNHVIRCIYCGYQTKESARDGHNYKFTVKDATYDAPGVKIGKCQDCGDVCAQAIPQLVKETNTKPPVNTQPQTTAATLKPSKISKVTVKNTKKRKISLQFSKSKNALSYKIQYSTDRKFKKNVKTITKKGLKHDIKNLKKGKTYWVRVCGIRNKLAGPWSKPKKVKIVK